MHRWLTLTLAVLVVACTRADGDGRTHETTAIPTSPSGSLAPSPSAGPGVSPAITPAMVVTATSTTIPAALSEWFAVDGSFLGTPVGSSAPLRGTLHLRVLEARLLDSIPSRTYPAHTPQGRYLAVAYVIRSDLNQEIGATVTAGNRMRAVDSRGREWQGNPAPGVEADAAALYGYRSGENLIGAGFSGRHVAVFDVPRDATGLRLVIRDWGISVPLGLP